MRKLFYILILWTPLIHAEEIFKKPLFLMGCDFEITVVAANQIEANSAFKLAENEIRRIETLISSWLEDSQTSMINRQSGIKAVKVDEELFQLIQRSLAISHLTDGAFDISYAAMDRIWQFSGNMKTLPSDELIATSVSKVGYENIELNQDVKSVFLKKAGMRIGFGGIGKGYAADRAKELLIKKGFNSGIINASGDMSVWGLMPNGNPWKVAITNPMAKEKAFALLPLNNQAIVTSGDYEKYVEIEGERFSHIIDPRTGWPTKGIISVTVIAPQAELADALATSVFVMGSQTGLDRINQIPQVECIIVKANGSILQSNNIQLETQ